MSGLLAPFAIPVLVYDQNALPIWSGRTLFEQELKAALVNLPRVPPRFRKEPLQALRFFALCSYNRLGVGNEHRIGRQGVQHSPQVGREPGLRGSVWS